MSSRVAVLSPSRFSHSLQEEERSGKEIGPDVPYVVFIFSSPHQPPYSSFATVCDLKPPFPRRSQGPPDSKVFARIANSLY